MDLSGVSGMAAQASAVSGGNVMQAIQTAVLKQTMDQQKAAGESLIRMMQNTPTAGSVGSIINIGV
jgi:hypothetical protein